MANKKLICFPFIDGDLQDYCSYELDEDERERVYNGESIEETLWNDKKLIWKPNEEIELTLHYIGYGRGRSSVTFHWKDSNGHSYPMFIKDVDDLLKRDICTSHIHGIFTYVKRGANYGIRLLETIE